MKSAFHSAGMVKSHNSGNTVQLSAMSAGGSSNNSDDIFAVIQCAVADAAARSGRHASSSNSNELTPVSQQQTSNFNQVRLLTDLT